MQTPHDHRTKLRKRDLDLFKKFKVRRILELCSGDGKNITALSKKGYVVIGIERPESMKAGTATSHLIFGKKLPFKRNTFDCVYSYQHLNHNFKHAIIRVFKEVHRVLKRNGIFSLHMADYEQFNFKHIREDIYEEQDPEFGKMRYKKLAKQTFAKLSGKEKGIPHYGFLKDELASTLSKIGFKTIALKKIKWNLAGNFKKK